MTKSIIVVKMPCKLTSWPYLISKVLVAYNHCCFLLALHLFTARLFLFSTSKKEWLSPITERKIINILTHAKINTMCVLVFLLYKQC